MGTAGRPVSPAPVTITIPDRCEHCGTAIGEIEHSEKHGGARVCRDCHFRGSSNPDHPYDSSLSAPASRRRSREALAKPQSSPPSLKPAVPSPSFLVPRFTQEQNVANQRVLEDEDGSEVERLLAEHAAKRIAPMPVELPQLPPSAPPVVRRVADFYVLVRGLRLAWVDDRPVLFACGWVGEKLSLPKTAVWRALNYLCDEGVLVRADPMPGRNGRRGTALFLPGVTVAALSDVPPPGAGTVEADRTEGVDQREEAGQDVAVRKAVADGRWEAPEVDGRIPASRDDADGRIERVGHRVLSRNATASTGGRRS